MKCITIAVAERGTLMESGYLDTGSSKQVHSIPQCFYLGTSVDVDLHSWSNYLFTMAHHWIRKRTYFTPTQLAQ